MKLEALINEHFDELMPSDWEVLAVITADTQEILPLSSEATANYCGVSRTSLLRIMKMLGAMYFFLRGTPYIYQGQELGMVNFERTSIGAMLSQLFCISEPVIFGLLIRYNLRPLYMVLISSGVGAAILSIFHIQSNAYGLAVIPSYLMYIYEGRQILIYFIVSFVSTALCFALTYLFAVPKEAIGADPASEKKIEVDKTKKTLQAISSQQ